MSDADYYRRLALRADARSRRLRALAASGMTHREIADAEGLSRRRVQEVIYRVLPEDPPRPRVASHDLTRGQVAYALGLDAHAI